MNSPGVPLNPELLAQLQSMQGGGAATGPSLPPGQPPPQADSSGMGGGQPTTQAPAGGAGGPDTTDPRAMIASNIQRVQSLNPEADAARQQMSGMSVPKMGPQIDKNAGFLHNLGQVLQMVAQATAPGAAIVNAAYRPGIQQYQGRQQQLAKQIGDVQGQQELAQRGATAAAEQAYHEDLIGERTRHNVETEDVQRQRVAAYQQGIENKLTTALKGLDIRGMLAGSTVALNAAKQKLAEVMPSILTERNALTARGQDMTSANSQARDNVLAQLGVDKAHPIAAMIDNWLGTTTEPAAPQTPGGAQPVRGDHPLPPRKPTAAAAPPRPANVPPNYVFKQNGPKGTGWYKPTGAQ